MNMFMERMANYDRLLDFSTAVTGTLFFVLTVGYARRLQAKIPAALS